MACGSSPGVPNCAPSELGSLLRAGAGLSPGSKRPDRSATPAGSLRHAGLSRPGSLSRASFQLHQAPASSPHPAPGPQLPAVALLRAECWSLPPVPPRRCRAASVPCPACGSLSAPPRLWCLSPPPPPQGPHPVTLSPCDGPGAPFPPPGAQGPAGSLWLPLAPSLPGTELGLSWHHFMPRAWDRPEPGGAGSCWD